MPVKIGGGAGADIAGHGWSEANQAGLPTVLADARLKKGKFPRALLNKAGFPDDTIHLQETI